MFGPRNLTELIDFSDFDWDDYRNEEKTKLNPKLEEMGYHGMQWYDETVDLGGDVKYDRRTCRAIGGKTLSLIGGEGKHFYFFYG